MNPASSGDRTWHEAEIEHFRQHPEEIAGYLDVALEEAGRDGDWGAFLASLRMVAEVNGGLGQLAAELDRSRPSLYRTLSEEGNPRLDTLGAVLHKLGYRLAIQPIEPHEDTA